MNLVFLLLWCYSIFDFVMLYKHICICACIRWLQWWQMTFIFVVEVRLSSPVRGLIVCILSLMQVESKSHFFSFVFFFFGCFCCCSCNEYIDVYSMSDVAFFVINIIVFIHDFYREWKEVDFFWFDFSFLSCTVYSCPTPTEDLLNVFGGVPTFQESAQLWKN